MVSKMKTLVDEGVDLVPAGIEAQDQKMKRIEWERQRDSGNGKMETGGDGSRRGHRVEESESEKGSLRDGGGRRVRREERKSERASLAGSRDGGHVEVPVGLENKVGSTREQNREPNRECEGK